MRSYLLFLLSTFYGICSYAQDPALEINGEIQISTNNSANPSPGTIRWTGADFEGWNGVIWVSLTAGKSVGMVVDADGNTYHTIKIGEQDWMTENLRVTQFADKTAIVQANPADDWDKQNGTSTAAYCWPNSNVSNAENYGLLYNGYVVDQVVNNGKEVCPSGWRLPTEADINELQLFLGADVAGNKMREKGNTYWSTYPNIEADNWSGYSGRGTGYRFADQGFYSFKELNFNWLSTAQNGSYKYFVLRSDEKILPINSGFAGLNDSGPSIRCIKE